MAIVPYFTCTRCNLEKPISEFYLKADGSKSGPCKVCRKVENAARYMGDREKYRQRKRQWKNANRDKVNKKKREAYALQHPAKWPRLQTGYTPRRQYLRTNDRRHSEQEWMWMLEFFGCVCLQCGSSDSIQRDHVIAVAIGGTDSITNIQPLCALCNKQKGWVSITDYRDAKRLVEFLVWLKGKYAKD